MHPQLFNFLEVPVLGQIIGFILGLFGKHPEIIPLHTFGVLLGLAFVAGISWGIREGRKAGFESEVIFNLSFWVLGGAIAGSRVLYVIIDLLDKGSRSGYVRHPLSILSLWEGGLVWYGGFFGAFLGCAYYTYKNKLAIWRIGDFAIPATFFGLSIGRLGCASVGDDFGRPIRAEWFKPLGLVFTDPNALVYPQAWKGIPLHATQIYMALGAFTVFLILRYMIPRKRFDGQVAFLGFVLYPINRSIIELFRGDVERGYVFKSFLFNHEWLSTSQAISIPVLIAGIAMLFYLRSRAPEVRIKGRFAPSSP